MVTEYPPKPSNLLDLLITNKKDEIIKYFTPEGLKASEYIRRLADNLELLNYNTAVGEYGEIGVERFYRELLGLWEQRNYVDIRPVPRNYKKIRIPIHKGETNNLEEKLSIKKNKLNALKDKVIDALSWVAFPLKFMSKTYDFILKKTNNHLLSYAVSIIPFYETLQLSGMVAFSAFASSTYNLPFLATLNTVLDFTFLPAFIYGGAAECLAAVGILGGIVAAESRFFSVSKIDKDEIVRDISKLSTEFYTVWSRYNKFINNSKAASVSLAELNATYMLITTKNSFCDKPSRKELKDHDVRLLASIEHSLGKKVSRYSIIHHSFEGVGGITAMVPSVLMGKITRKHAFGPIFINKNRISAHPSYDFAVAHEFAHAAGAITEPMANYHALNAFDDLADKYPRCGYDLYATTNRLCFAVSALSTKIKDTAVLKATLKKAGVPTFVLQAFDENFDPEHSPVPPLKNTLENITESKFADLYAASSYIASKLVEHNEVKPFSYRKYK
jgi:hypothetical protein